MLKFHGVIYILNCKDLRQCYQISGSPALGANVKTLGLFLLNYCAYKLAVSTVQAKLGGFEGLITLIAPEMGSLVSLLRVRGELILNPEFCWFCHVNNVMFVPDEIQC